MNFWKIFISDPKHCIAYLLQMKTVILVENFRTGKTQYNFPKKGAVKTSLHKAAVHTTFLIQYLKRIGPVELFQTWYPTKNIRRELYLPSAWACPLLYISISLSFYPIFFRRELYLSSGWARPLLSSSASASLSTFKLSLHFEAEIIAKNQAKKLEWFCSLNFTPTKYSNSLSSLLVLERQA